MARKEIPITLALALCLACSAGSGEGGGGSFERPEGSGGAETSTESGGSNERATGGSDAADEAPDCPRGPGVTDWSCPHEGQLCVYPGGACSTNLRCVDGEWQPETSCVSSPECPHDVPQEGEACSLPLPTFSPLVCIYTECGTTQADCDGDTWTVRHNPRTTECRDLCNATCQRLIECGITWASQCTRDCYAAYACPGPSEHDDRTLCSSSGHDLDSSSCSALCERVTSASNAHSFGQNCGGI